MAKPELTESEEKAYKNILEFGTKEDMFEIGYAIGRARLAAEQIEKLEKLSEFSPL